ncbi:MAG TPA: transglycosylase domain-containing protein [Polyangiaceae bacterium]|nr:transglycosylase domain-containing protein [Polyangiaceae bacterium]
MEEPPPRAEPASSGAHPRRELAFRVLKWTAAGVVVAVAAAVLSVVLVVRHYQAGLPSVADLKTYHPPEVTRVLARDGTVLASVFVERRTVVPFAEIPQHVKLAFLAAEDASFYEHRGLNYLGMLRALVVNVRAGHTKQGASTITQQVIKNVVLTADRNYERKIKETILARELERTLTKDEIFELYLNQIYLGHGRFGVEEASRYYFGKKVRDIDLTEAATLAGLVASPERYSPRHDETRSLERRHYVLDQMLEKGFITRELRDAAFDAPLRLAPVSDGESDLAPEAVSYALAELQSLVGPKAPADPNTSSDQALRGGYVLTTSIDPALQAAGRKAVRDALDAYAHRQKLEAPFTAETKKLWGKPATVPPKPNKAAVGHVVALDDGAGSIDVDVGGARCRALLRGEERFNPKHLPASDFTKVGALLRVAFDAPPPATPSSAPAPCHLALGPEAALVAIDVRTREVRALIGGYDAISGGLDRATSARRQPGSAFKPFLYSFALSSRRFTPASVLTLPNVARPGHPAVLTDAGVPAENRRLSVRDAIAQSDNDAAALLLKEVGPPNVVAWAHALGIESDLQPTPSLALGAYEVTPLELVNAVATFAAGGELEPPKIVVSIEGGGVRLPPRVPKHRVMSVEEAYLTTSLLESVVERGTGQRAKTLKRPVAGKTGTTNGAKDAWFVGFSPELVAGVWVGYDEPLPLGGGESGAVTALPAWVSFMKAAHEGHPATEFPKPSGIVTVHIDPATGLLAYAGQTDAVDEEFLEGTAPSTVASPDAGAPEPAAARVDGGADDETAEGAAQGSEATDSARDPKDAGSAAAAGAVVAPF